MEEVRFAAYHGVVIVGGHRAGWGRAWAHTMAYTRGYFFFGLLSLAFGPIVIFHFGSLLVVVPSAFAANLFFVRLFPKRSWVREPGRARTAAMAGVPLVWLGTVIWLTVGGKPPASLTQLGDWATALYFVTIPVLFSNLGVLLGYLTPGRGGPSSRDS